VRLHHPLSDPTIYHFPRLPLMTFSVSNPTSLFCLTIVILSLNTQDTPGFHFINICNTLCLTFLTAYIATRTTSPSPASDAPQTLSPTPPSRTPPSPPSLYRRMLHPGVEGVWTRSGLDAELTLQQQVKTRSSISRRRNPSKVQFPNDPYLSATILPSHLDSGSGVSISSLEDLPSEGEETGGTTQLVHLPKIPDTDPDVECPAVGGDPASNFRDRPPCSSSSESSAS